VRELPKQRDAVDFDHHGDDARMMDMATDTNGVAAAVIAAEPQPLPSDTFLNTTTGAIGRTASTKFEANTSSRFLFWIAKPKEGFGEITLEIGNIVAAQSDDDTDVTFGTIVEMRSYSDVDSFIADYLSHDFGNATIQVPTDVSEVVVVTCNVMRNLSLKTKPIGRSQVFFPSEVGIRYAYGIVDNAGRTVFAGAEIPIGVFQNGDGTTASVSVDEDFVIGPEGAHLNVSGISGLASKTSAVQFILKSLLTHTAKRVAVVMFNVKSRDLLYIDQPNPRLDGDDWSATAYDRLNIPMQPFAGARFFAPADPKNQPDGTQSRRTLPTDRFTWDLQLMKQDIPSLFDADDWDDKMENLWWRISDEIDRAPLVTYTQMLQWVNGVITNATQQQGRGQQTANQWPHGHHIGSWHKMSQRLHGFPKSYKGLIRTAGQGQDIPWSQLAANSVYVIDIQMLGDRGKKLVFGRAIRELAAVMEKENKQIDAIAVFVDELNKFAPSGNVRTPLKSRLVDITARGRSMGLVLFGAEQFASSVEKDIIENSSTYLFGRTEANELRSANYAALSDEIKTKLMMLPQGSLLAKFAKFPQPIFVRFPYPPCMPGDQYKPAG
jgi:uncharacterized protein